MLDRFEQFLSVTFQPRRENAYFPLPLIGVIVVTIILWTVIAGGTANLFRLVAYYTVWCGAVAVLMATANVVLGFAKNLIEPERSRPRERVYVSVAMAVGLAGMALAFGAAAALFDRW